MNKLGIALVIMVVCAGWSGMVPAVFGQVPEDVALDSVRTRSSIPSGEPAIDNWITFRINKLRDELQVGSKQADNAFSTAYLAQLRHEENSASFKMRFMERTNKRFAAEFKKEQGLEVAVGLTLARVLAEMNDVGAIPALSAGLEVAGQPAVRYTCVKAFEALMPEIEDDTVRSKAIIERLGQTGTHEHSGVVRKQIYKSLSRRGPNFNVATDAIFDIMEAQLRIRAQSAPAYDGAEEMVFGFLRNELSNVRDKNRLVAILGTHLRLDVERYLTKGISMEEKFLIELTIDAAESLLRRVAAPPAPVPNIRDAMSKIENQDLNMPLELNKWIGTAQTPGVLNKAPWNVPVNAPAPK
ncbi:MAG: hypothetical protein KAV82_05950 [Phycisphaerae bacterium]|nr:hypothetical protein [Phycisphaerae bacterium]